MDIGHIFILEINQSIKSTNHEKSIISITSEIPRQNTCISIFTPFDSASKTNTKIQNLLWTFLNVKFCSRNTCTTEDGHRVKTEDMKIIEKEPNWRRRIVKEALWASKLGGSNKVKLENCLTFFSFSF